MHSVTFVGEIFQFDLFKLLKEVLIKTQHPSFPLHAASICLDRITDILNKKS